MKVAISLVENQVTEFHSKKTKQKKKTSTHKINLDIYAMIIVSLTVLNGRAAILSSQTWPY